MNGNPNIKSRNAEIVFHNVHDKSIINNDSKQANETFGHFLI